METLQLAQGTYQLKDPIINGSLETFPANAEPAGKPVYVHRVHLLDASASELEGLLATALACSDNVRRRIVETGERSSYWYAVTAAEQRCLSLREWLQLEVDRAGPATVVKPPSTPAAAPLPEPGEFTRLFMTNQRSHPAPKPALGEATVKFNTPDAATDKKPGPLEPGEFTQQFGGKVFPSKPIAQRPIPSAQRPDTPVPARYAPEAKPPDASGSFPGATPLPDNVRIPPGSPPMRYPSPDLSKPAPPTDSIFRRDAKAPVLPPSEEAKPGEYTRLFGKGAQSPASQPEAMGHTPLPPLMPDSPRAIRTAPSSQGGRPFDSPSFSSPSSPSTSAAPPPAAKPAFNLPMNANFSPMNPIGQMNQPSANIGMQGASVQSPIGSANLSAPPLQMPPMQMGGPPSGAMSPQTKMIVFFSILAILAVVLVVFLVATQKP